MDLPFQVPMKYCSLQHLTLLSSPVPSTTGSCFCFGSISSFFLELFLHSSPVAYGALLTWGINLSVSYLLPFHTVHGVLKAGMLKWFAIPFSSGPHFVRTIHYSNQKVRIYKTSNHSGRETIRVQTWGHSNMSKCTWGDALLLSLGL